MILRTAGGRSSMSSDLRFADIVTLIQATRGRSDPAPSPGCKTWPISLRSYWNVCRLQPAQTDAWILTSPIASTPSAASTATRLLARLRPICCSDLVKRVLPGWHWHVGYGPEGVLPYASLYSEQRLYEATAGTVPLAPLSALLRARVAT